MELKLTNVARASLEELRLEYEDFLRQRGLPLWAKDDPRRTHLVARRCATADDVAKGVKEIHDGQAPSISSIKPTYPEIAANAARDISLGKVPDPKACKEGTPATSNFDYSGPLAVKSRTRARLRARAR